MELGENKKVAGRKAKSRNYIIISKIINYYKKVENNPNLFWISLVGILVWHVL